VKIGVVQKLMISGNTFHCGQKAQFRETEGLGLVALFQKCNPQLNHA
jgi:hypothetical protein